MPVSVQVYVIHKTYPSTIPHCQRNPETLSYAHKCSGSCHIQKISQHKSSQSQKASTKANSYAHKCSGSWNTQNILQHKSSLSQKAQDAQLCLQVFRFTQYTKHTPAQILPVTESHQEEQTVMPVNVQVHGIQKTYSSTNPPSQGKPKMKQTLCP